jgi:D-alanyl-D-alanine dipeptidase
MSSLVDLQTYIPSIKLDILYASTHNFTGIQLYPVAKAYLETDPAAALANVQKELIKTHKSLVVWDAYRPHAVTKKMWEVTPEDKKIYVANPAHGSIHNRGCAVDVTIYDLATNKLLEMPSDFDEFEINAYADFQGASVDAINNRDLLIKIMKLNGFRVNPHEWWHFNWNEWKQYPVLDTPIDAL